MGTVVHTSDADVFSHKVLSAAGGFIELSEITHNLQFSEELSTAIVTIWFVVKSIVVEITGMGNQLCHQPSGFEFKTNC